MHPGAPALPGSLEDVVAVLPSWPLIINCGRGTVPHLVNTVDSYV